MCVCVWGGGGYGYERCVGINVKHLNPLNKASHCPKMYCMP